MVVKTIQLELPTSMTHRIAVFQFVIDDTVEEPTIEFISEDPYLQYVRMDHRMTAK